MHAPAVTGGVHGDDLDSAIGHLYRDHRISPIGHRGSGHDADRRARPTSSEAR
jgi:hypothetical protein